MTWLQPDLPASLTPGRRPRTTLSPSLALRDGQPALAFGSPGGDQQDQWQLSFFLNHVLGGMDLQASIDAPSFHSIHFPSSFYPRAAFRAAARGRQPARHAGVRRGPLSAVTVRWRSRPPAAVTVDP